MYKSIQGAWLPEGKLKYILSSGNVLLDIFTMFFYYIRHVLCRNFVLGLVNFFVRIFLVRRIAQPFLWQVFVYITSFCVTDKYENHNYLKPASEVYRNYVYI